MQTDRDIVANRGNMLPTEDIGAEALVSEAFCCIGQRILGRLQLYEVNFGIGMVFWRYGFIRVVNRSSVKKQPSVGFKSQGSSPWPTYSLLKRDLIFFSSASMGRFRSWKKSPVCRTQ